VSLAAIGLRLFDRADLFLLSMLGGSAASLGQYGAAQNLTVILSLLAAAVSPVVLTAITRLRRAGDLQAIHEGQSQVLSLPYVLLPFAGLAAGAAPEIMRTIYGAGFADAASPFALLMIGSIALLIVAFSTVLLVAGDRPWSVLVVSTPMLVALVALALWLIPVHGLRGAAIASLAASMTGGGIAQFQAHRLLHAHVRFRTVAVGTGLAVAMGFMARAWDATTPVSTVLELTAGSALIAVVLIALQEVQPAQWRSLLARPEPSTEPSTEPTAEPTAASMPAGRP
jgi:O-antigen/teichoic acid export membrane protein